MTIRELAVKIGFDVNDKAIKNLDRGIKHLKGSILAIGTATVAIGGSLFALARNVANIGDEARKTAQALGLTTEELQELQFAAGIGGVNQQEMNTALRTLAKGAKEASEGIATYKDEFDLLGITVTDRNGELKSTNQLFNEMVIAMSKLPDSAKKTAIASTLMGRSGAKMIPLFNSGIEGLSKLRTEANELGFVISDKAAQANEEFNDSIFRLMAAIRGIRITIAQGLIPQLTEMITWAKAWIRLNNELIKQKLTKAIEILVRTLKILFGIIKTGISILSSLINTLGGLERIIKYVSFALAFFLGAKILLGIGLITQGILGLIVAIKTLGLAAVLAQAKLLLIPILIGAAVVALGLIIEDIIAFFQGRNSITGVIIDSFGKKFPNAFNAAKIAFKGLINFFKFQIEILKLAFTGLWIVLQNIFSIEFYKNAFETIKKFIPPVIDKIGSMLNKVGNIIGITPGSIPISNKNISNNNIQTNKITAPITVNVPAGTPTEQLGPVIKTGLREELNAIFRQTSLATEPQIE